MSRLDWSRPLPRPLTIPIVMKLSTLADVRDLVDKHLPEQYRRKPTWQHVSTEIARAAEGEKDPLEISVVAAGAGVGRCRLPGEMTTRRFPPPWTVASLGLDDFKA